MMIDLETDHITKPTTLYDRYMLSSQRAAQMAESYDRMAQEAEDTYLPDTAASWKARCIENAAKKRKDAAEWEAMANANRTS